MACSGCAERARLLKEGLIAISKGDKAATARVTSEFGQTVKADAQALKIQAGARLKALTRRS